MIMMENGGYSKLSKLFLQIPARNPVSVKVQAPEPTHRPRTDFERAIESLALL